MGPVFRAPLWVRVVATEMLRIYFCASVSQARASWKWLNFAQEQCQPGRRFVLANLDESMISLWQGGRRGYIVMRTGECRKSFLDREEHGPLSARRMYASLIALISDDPVVQEQLPLFLVVNEHHLSASCTEMVQADLRENKNCILLRRRSAWNTSSLMLTILGEVAKRVRLVKPSVQLCLLLDVAPCHIHQSVIRSAHAHGIILVFVAARMTSTLQPLDVYVFSALKKYIADSYERLAVQSGDGKVLPRQFVLEMLRVTEKFIFQRTWGHAFAGCGFGGRQELLCSQIRKLFPEPIPPGGLGAG